MSKKEKHPEKEIEIDQAEDVKAAANEGGETEIEAVSDIEKVTAELAESKDKYLRLYSEFENYRRRTAKEKLELISTATESLMADLIPVLDDFERAAASNKDADAKTIQEGFDLIYNKFKNILTQKGLKLMEVGTGSDFDADVHEAITQIPAPKKKLKGKVVDVIEKGYYLGEKVIRFAKVVIGA